MSKTEMKLAAAVETLVRVIKESNVMSAAVDIGTCRTMFGLTSMGRKAIARAVDDVLTTNGIVDQFGPWVMAEIEHPSYQLSQLTANRVEFDDGPKGAPVELYVQAGLGMKDGYVLTTDEIKANAAGDDEEDEEDDVANAKALDAADAQREAEDADWATFIESSDYTYLAKAGFNPTEIKTLFDKGLVGGEEGEDLTIGQLRAALASNAKKIAPEPEAKKAKAKPAKKNAKRAPVVKKTAKK